MLIDPKYYRMGAVMINAVMTKAILIAGGYYLGTYLDEKWHTEPYMMISLIVLGITLGLWWIIFLANRFKL